MINLKSVAQIFEESNFELLPYNDANGGNSYYDTQGCHDFDLPCFKEIVKTHNIDFAIEIGSFVGLGAIKMFENISTLKKLICVDPWMWPGNHHKGVSYFPKPFEQFCSNIKHMKLDDKIFPWRTTSQKASQELLNTNKFDLIHIDAIHDYENVLHDLTVWEPYLKDGGVICGDDWVVIESQIVSKEVCFIDIENFRPFGGVQSALKEFLSNRSGYDLHACQNFYWLVKNK